MDQAGGAVEAVHASPTHTMSKVPRPSVRLLVGLGIEGDAHMGATVKHRSRVRIDPDQPNLRQVHLLHGELLDELRAQGLAIAPGDMGENITTRGLDLLSLPTGALLRLGPSAVIEITGLRNPCGQLNGLQDGLLGVVAPRDGDGNVVRKGGVMSVVVRAGTVAPGDAITIDLPPPPHRGLVPV